MKKLLKILNWFLVFLGIVFLILIVIAAYLFIADPWQIKPWLKTFQLSTAVPNADQTPTDKNPLLNAEQEKTLESLGIDPAALPSQITPTMEKCFVEKLGATRVAEIKKSGQPTATDFLEAKTCLSN